MTDADDPDLTEKARAIETLLLDVDGVLTNGGIVLAGESFEAKIFDVQDGMGVTLARRAGLSVGIITGRVSDAVRRRAEELDIDRVYQGHFWKEDALDEILADPGTTPDQLAFMGDDVLDVPVLRNVGLALAPSSARPEVREECDYVSDEPGGNGAVRDAVDWLLEQRGDKQEVYDYYRRGRPNDD